ncbi:MAG: GAF domain-containing sensor histidine kinase [Chitinophagaceae bacterium]|nr:MAG: GAF domain-containing sensor histidine kinase [Chitinophagaceae bacterium]
MVVRNEGVHMAGANTYGNRQDDAFELSGNDRQSPAGKQSGGEPPYPVPENEEQRIQALDTYHIMDTAEEKDFDELTQLASVICGTPIALVTFIDRDRQWMKSHHGTTLTQTPREYAFCTHAIADPANVMVVPDATLDMRFRSNPLVTGETNISFYAGVPLVNQDGFALGSLCVIDHVARDLHPQQVNALVTLARQVVDKLELRRKSERLEQVNIELASSLDALNTANLKLQEMDIRKDEFLGMVSHELKTPITSLKASLQLMEISSGQTNNELQPLLVRKSLRSTEKINELVDDLLTMHRFGEKQLRMGMSHFNIYRLLQDCASEKPAGKAITTRVEGEQDLSVFADEHRIEQVVSNLLGNAMKYANQSDEIVLTVKRSGTMIRVSVRDQGPGIPAEHIPYLFDRYWRADHMGSTYSGLGLGLYICSEIISRHNGRIGVESEAGQGAEFWFELPA